MSNKDFGDVYRACNAASTECPEAPKDFELKLPSKNGVKGTGTVR
jgi:hypothetical protein